ncbi:MULTISPECIES: hypothetical protein [Bacillus]|uniref:hypothetical protein n=1 Tax=Bacillus TaxID=1386 RepID=UPI0011AA2083|nr:MULTISPECIES: hypothetical protein [Bacillus]MBG9882741.1 hypothetical protein [Bacillus paralicheniformis]MDE1437651.1 hypothetical protein [Bacillus licheniformis]MDQ9094257.1 hypothetical protein [Bacillus licheniformis]MDU0071691.1 hypothetical protein [Bacillus sp. IG6]MEC0479128.1 hypothetical protein [Bacillus licheniformis]
MSIGLEIKRLLDEGYTVKSAAAGRVGEITSVSDSGHQIYFRPRNKKWIGITTFNIGDKVRIEKRDDHYEVVNVIEN